MQRRSWLIAAALILVAGAALGIALLYDRPGNDCQTIRAIIDYNKQHNQLLNSTTGFDTDNQALENDSRQWADHLRELSQDVSDPKLASHARAVAELAKGAVTLMAQAHDGEAAPQDQPPPWISEYAELDQRFRAEITTLDEACPA